MMMVVRRMIGIVIVATTTVGIAAPTTMPMRSKTKRIVVIVGARICNGPIIRIVKHEDFMASFLDEYI
jgi:hypothetical protein